MAGSNSSMKEQVQSVKQLGDKMGYGHLMALASALWRKKLCDEHGERYKSGAFIAVVDCVVEPEHLRKMKAELELYDYIVKSVLEVNENG